MIANDSTLVFSRGLTNLYQLEFLNTPLMAACYLFYQIILLPLFVMGVELLVVRHILMNLELEEFNQAT